MSKKRRKSSKSRRRSKKSNNSSLFIYGVGAAIIFAVFALIATSGGLPGDAPNVEDSRLELDPVLGDPEAPVTLIEYGAYSCTACRAFHRSGAIQQLQQEYGDQINIVFRDYPVISPRYDRMSANIAQCALDQGNDLFWAYHDMLYNAPLAPPLSQNELVELGGNLGLDVEQLGDCASSETHVRTVQYDQNRAQDLGLRSTPSFVVNGQVIIGGSIDRIRSAINNALSS